MSNEKLPNKLKRITSSLSSLLMGSILLTTVPTKAESFQLVDMGCRVISPPTMEKQALRLRAKKVLIGNQEFDEVAVFGDGSFSDSIQKKEPIFIICPIASGNNYKFQSLRLQFGLDSRNKKTNPNTIVRLNLEFNGQPFESKDIRAGQNIDWIIDVKNIKNIGLTAECIQDDGRARFTNCPPISFTDMTLSTSPVSSLKNTNSNAKNTVLLTDMECTKGKGIYYAPLRPVVEGYSKNPEIFYVNIGRQRVREVAFLGKGGSMSDNHKNDYIIGSSETSCKTPPYFQKLNLVYGIDDQARNKKPIELSVYINGQLVGKRRVNPGQKPQSWNIPLSNPRVINLEAKCLAQYGCSRLSFTKLNLE